MCVCVSVGLRGQRMEWLGHLCACVCVCVCYILCTSSLHMSGFIDRGTCAKVSPPVVIAIKV